MIPSHNQTLAFVMKTIPLMHQQDIYSTRSEFITPSLTLNKQNRLFPATNSTTYVLKTPLSAFKHCLAGLAISMISVDILTTPPNDVVNCINLHAIILQVILQRKFKHSRRTVAYNQSIIQHVHCTSPQCEHDEFDDYYKQVLIYLPTAKCFLTHMPLPPLPASWLRLHDTSWTVASGSFVKETTQVFTISNLNKKTIECFLRRPFTRFSPPNTIYTTKQVLC
jgi:hypothetical protein